jgi:hypothetical protein
VKDPDDLTDSYESAYAAGRQDGYNDDGRTDRWADLLAVFRAIRILVAEDGQAITLDLSAVSGQYGVRSMILYRDADDVWFHGPSGVSGPLSEVVIGIAWSYARFPDNGGES